MCFSQGISDGGDIDTARSKVHNALKYVDTYKPIWYIIYKQLYSDMYHSHYLMTGTVCH